MPVEQPDERLSGDNKEAYIRQRNQEITSAIERAKAKNKRLRLMKEINENYLAERGEESADELSRD